VGRKGEGRARMEVSDPGGRETRSPTGQKARKQDTLQKRGEVWKARKTQNTPYWRRNVSLCREGMTLKVNRGKQ